MAYRRRHGLSRSSTFKEEGVRFPPDHDDATTSSAAIPHTSSDSRLDSLRSGAGSGGLQSSFKNRSKDECMYMRYEGRILGKQGSPTYDYSSMKSTNERGGFWGVLARKAKAILDDEIPQQSSPPSRVKQETVTFSTSNQVRNQSESFEDSKKVGSPTLGMKLERLTPSLNQIGSSIGNTPEKCTGIQVRNHNESFEDSKKVSSPTLGMKLERLTPSLNQIGSIIGNTQENRKAVKIEEKNEDPRVQLAQPQMNLETQNRKSVKNEEKNEDPRMQSAQPQMNQQSQIQASRDVAIATAAKVKQLMRMLKTVKAELALVQDRCSQLEDENKSLVGAHKRDHPADDEMIRDQLEALLEEKGRLAHENSVFALENRYLREIVEFHQLRMQDLMYLEEGIIEEVTLPTTPPEADQDTVEGSSIILKLPITPLEVDYNMVSGSSIMLTLPTTPPEADQNTVEGSSIMPTLPTTPPEADQHMVDGSSSSSSRSA
ncbi:hypothetical protein QVD17_15416 [Tagetes erecta]|uniref:Uncharacterized protein n=1 Tax=Tagetes erecta TaxID=13708 RepID=A0AAD8NZI1_TARER|nr:hypothetical protein QVD17_15416 [Tagetes erecta]